MNPLLFHPEKKHFRCSKKGLKYIMAQKEGGTYSKRTWGAGLRKWGMCPPPPPEKKKFF